jgi:hypothetical protein
VFYAFDPRRKGILLIGGEKTGNPHFYEIYIPIADKILPSTCASWSANKGG